MAIRDGREAPGGRVLLVDRETLEDARGALADYVERIESREPMTSLNFGKSVIRRLDAYLGGHHGT